MDKPFYMTFVIASKQQQYDLYIASVKMAIFWYNSDRLWKNVVFASSKKSDPCHVQPSICNVESSFQQPKKISVNCRHIILTQENK